MKNKILQKTFIKLRTQTLYIFKKTNIETLFPMCRVLIKQNNDRGSLEPVDKKN